MTYYIMTNNNFIPLNVAINKNTIVDRKFECANFIFELITLYSLK